MPEILLRGIYDKINDLRIDHDSELRRRDLTVDSLRSENASLRRRLRTLLSDADDRDTVSEYARLITENMPPPHVADGSSYALKLQTQLHRALDQIGTLQGRLGLLQQQTEESEESSERARELRNKLAERGDERFRAEVEHTNDLLSMEREMATRDVEGERRLARKERELVRMKAELEREREAHRRTSEAFSPREKGGGSAAATTAPPPLPSSLLETRRDDPCPFVKNRAA